MSQTRLLAFIAAVLSPCVLGLPTHLQTCPLTFDGRIPQNFTRSTFDTAQSPFNPKYVLGQSNITHFASHRQLSSAINTCRSNLGSSHIFSRCQAVDIRRSRRLKTCRSGAYVCQQACSLALRISTNDMTIVIILYSVLRLRDEKPPFDVLSSSSMAITRPFPAR